MIKQFLIEFKQTGSLIPSSSFLSTAFKKCIPNNAQSILEIGAGTGAISKFIIDNDKYFVLNEINKDFDKNLFLLEKDNVKINIGSFENIEGKFDHIICSIPFKNFSENDIVKYIIKIKSLLNQNGTISFFEYNFFFNNKVLNIFKKHFNYINSNNIWLNFPPATIHNFKL